jgi:hypothetical protein
MRDVDDPDLRRDARDHAMAHADEVVAAAVVAQERDEHRGEGTPSLMDAERDAPSGLPEEEPEAPPMGVPDNDEDPEVGDLPGIPEEGEPPNAG